jgi:predicted RNase H-like HicB family nuclease
MNVADYSIFVTWCETLSCYIATAPELGGIFIGDGQTRTEAIEAGEKALNHWRESATKAGEEMPQPLVHLDLLEILERIAFSDQNEERTIFASGWEACFQQFAGYLISHGLQDATIGFEEALGKYRDERAARKKNLEEMIFGATE